MSERDSSASPKDHSREKTGVPVLNFLFTWDKQAITHPLFPMPWPSGELKHTLLVRVPVGAALWGVEVVSEWRLREMGMAGLLNGRALTDKEKNRRRLRNGSKLPVTPNRYALAVNR